MGTATSLGSSEMMHSPRSSSPDPLVFVIEGAALLGLACFLPEVSNAVVVAALLFLPVVVVAAILSVWLKTTQANSRRRVTRQLLGRREEREARRLRSAPRRTRELGTLPGEIRLETVSTRPTACPYCGDCMGDEARSCPRCDTPHHVGCWSENQGCTIFGCEERPRPRFSARY